MDVKNTHSVTKTEISVFGRQALDAERRRSPSLADNELHRKSGMTRVGLQFKEADLVENEDSQNVRSDKDRGITSVMNIIEGKQITAEKRLK